MLHLNNIKKDYQVADSKVNALKGVTLSFRQNEFVSVLGPSGCGKTTLLNIIGGLDQYTSGDLVIAGRSTKEFADKDWDVYRNHRIGFIFQSYNLIPHQTVLGNVELALTIAGMGKAERTEKAKAALDKVGLSKEYYKRPNQLSGGQSQRVAIARALVNDPEILLADEPTGALDTVTSVQIMDLIKEIAQEKLVIMVTHNPELAEKYSTRIIRLLDGELVSDSNPFSVKAEKREVAVAKAERELKEFAELEGLTKKEKKKRARAKEKAKMSFFTSFRLSLQNLFTKKARTIMTSVAGSIGIIGISLVLSISYGISSYIDNMQEDMLSGNPITISRSAIDLNSLMDSTTWYDQKDSIDMKDGQIQVNSMVEYLMSRSNSLDNMMVENTITEEYVQYLKQMPKEYLSMLYLDYGLDVTNNIYTDFQEKAGGAADNISLSALTTIYTAVLGETDYADFAGYIASLSDVFRQMPDNTDYIASQYRFVEGKMPTKKNEVMIVLNSDGQLSDLLLARLGYYSQEEFLNMTFKAAIEIDPGAEDYYDENIPVKESFTYEELMGRTFTWYPNDTVYNETPMTSIDTNGLPTMLYNPFTYNYQSDGFSDKDAVELEVVGILMPKDEISYGCLSSGFYYTDELASYAIEKNENSKVATHISSADGSIVSMDSMTIKIDQEKFDMLDQLFAAMGIPNPFPVDKIGKDIPVSPIGITYEFDYSFLGTPKPSKTGFVGSSSAMTSMLGSMMGQDIPAYYTLDLNDVGGTTLPSRISVYPVDFDQKEYVLAYLDKWNGSETLTVGGVAIAAADRAEITYSDTLSLVIEIINNMINVITYALVAFTALSLVVSCVMIAIITYVSVVERTKEIGVIRSLGGRKRDVSSLFNAETFIIGLISGLIGIGVTYLLSFVINLIVNSLASIGTIALFPLHYAGIMLLVSILLTTISGLLPSRSAAKKDPVVALRTE